MRLFILYMSLFFSVISINAQVVINEYSGANLADVTDNFNEYEDWIELYNSGSSSVNLTGYYLSDSKTNTQKWQFGNTTINAGAFLRIWASGRDIKTGTLHTNFKLTQTKPEAIVFSDAGGTILDSLTMRPNLQDHSRGRTTDGAATWSVFKSPTPNSTNTGAWQEYATKPAMSLAPGFYSGTQSLTITSPDPNVTIYYTTNGSTPTTSSTTYSGPITISNTTVVRARAFSSISTIPESFVEQNTYFINASHTVPVVSVFGSSTGNLLNGQQIEPQTGLEYFDAQGVYRAESYGVANKHGNDSWAYDQRGIDFVSKDELGYNYAINHKLFTTKSRQSFQRVMLKAGASDNYPFENGGAHIRDAFAQTVSQLGQMHMDERSASMCVMYMNGQYWGVYDLREKVDDHDFTEYYFNTGADSLQYLKTWGNTWSEYGGNQAQTDWDNLKNFITGNNMAVQSNYDYVDSLLNIQSFTDYFIFGSYTVCADWLNWNTSWWRGINVGAQKRKWRYTLWDVDAIFGHYVNYTGIPNQSSTADPCDPASLNDPGGQGHTDIMNALIQNSGYQSYYVNRYADLMNSTLNCTNVLHVLDSMVAVIDPEMQAHVNKWGGSYNGWKNNVDALRDSIQNRCTNLWNQFQDCPEYNTTGPFTIYVDVQPAGSGTVTINSITPANYMWSGQYFGNQQFNLTGNAGGGYVFDHWQLNNHTVSPSVNDSAVNFTLNSGDTIVAWFVPNANMNQLTVLVNPPNSGKVDLNSFLIPNYPYTTAYNTGDAILMKAVANAGNSFIDWQLNNHTVSPSSTDSIVTFTITTHDTVIANFNALPTLTVLVNPPLAGNVEINSFTIPTYPYVSAYSLNQLLNLKAMAAAGFEFTDWSALHHAINPSMTDSLGSFTFTQSDTLIANFTATGQPTLTVLVNPPGSGNVVLGGNTLTTFPHIATPPVGQGLTAEANAFGAFEFSSWTLNHHSMTPSLTDSSGSFTFNQTDTLVANFANKEVVVFRVNPAGAGTIGVNGNLLTAFPASVPLSAAQTVGLEGNANANFQFANWTTTLHTINPSTTDSTASFVMAGPDTITANFDPALPIVFDVVPAGGGTITVNASTLPYYPYTGYYTNGTSLNVAAAPTGGYKFLNWTSQNHTLNPNDTSIAMGFVVVSSDAITAYFELLPVPPIVPYTGIHIPTAFSPNNDGQNDELFVLQGYDVESFEMVMYDRWGNLAFKTASRNEGWDGKMNGKPAEEGAYGYQMKAVFTDGSTKTVTGNITLLR